MKIGRSKIKEKGFTLVELMVALLISMIFLAGVYSLYINTQKTYTQQEKLVEVQQNSRAVMEQMARELRLAGYLRACAPPLAKPTAFEFEADTNFNGAVERIQYRLNGANLERAWAEPAPVSCAPLSSGFETISTNMEVLNFDYYDKNNGLLNSNADATTGVAAAELSDIRRVTVRLQADTGEGKTVSLAIDVKLRNEGLAETGGCQPPSTVTGVSVDDIQVCGRAKVTWNANDPKEQIQSYKVYARVAGSGPWTISSEATGGTTTNLILSGLSNGTAYDFAVAARNTCGLREISDSDIRTLGPLSDAIAPDPATNLNSSASATNNLTWTESVTKDKYTNSITPTDVDGYDIYRSTDGTNYSKINDTLVKGASYTDTVPKACSIYYYKIKAIDTCGNESNYSSYTAGDAALTNAFVDVPVDKSSNTRPSETVKPADPEALAAVAGGQYPVGSGMYRISLSWQNPNDSDFQGTRVLYREQNKACVSGDYPTSPTGSTFLVDELGGAGASESHNYDIFQNNKYYCFTAFAYDYCTNYSTGSQATAQARTCGDDPVGVPPPIELNSLKDKKSSDVSGENRGTATIGWAYQNWTTIPDFVGFNVYRTPAPDRFNKSFVYNSETYYAVTSTPIFFPSTFIPEFEDNEDDGKNTCVGFGPDGTSDTKVEGDDVADNTGINGGLNGKCDSTANSNPSVTPDDIQIVTVGSFTNPGITTKLLPGVTYKYLVRAVECDWDPAQPHESTAPSPNIVTVQPGKLTRDTAVSVTTTGTKPKQFNIVNFAMKNTSASTMTVRSSGPADTATISWTNTSARLTNIVLNGTTLWQGSPSGTCTGGICSTTVTFTGGVAVSGGALNQAASFTFKKTDGSPSVDMRGNTITVVISYRNDTSFASNNSQLDSTNTTTFTMTTATGAFISNTKQDPPKNPFDPNSPATPRKSDEGGVPPGWSVSATSPVTITTNATVQSGSVSSVSLQYCVDSAFSATAPDPTSVTCTYTEASMNSIGGGNYEKILSALPGSRIWFFIQAQDNQGQVSVDPPQTGDNFIAFTYDQLANLVVTFTAEFMDFRQVQVDATVKDQSNTAVSGADVTIKIGGETHSGTTDLSGNLSVVSDAFFTEGDVPISVEATKAPAYNLGSCTKTLPGSGTSVSCP